MTQIPAERLGNEVLRSKIMTAEEAAKLVKDGDTVGVSGFTPSAYPKVVPPAIAKRATEGGEKFKINLYSGASLGPECDTALTEAGVINYRMPYQTNATIRKAINAGEVKYTDMHLSHSTQYVNYGFIPRVNVAIVEAIQITPEGHFYPATAVGNVQTYVNQADVVIIELNCAKPLEMVGMHDIYECVNPPEREPIPIKKPGDRVGTPYVKCGLDKISAIVYSDLQDTARPLTPVDETSQKIADNMLAFLHAEVAAGRLPKNLLPMQSGVGSVANAVLYGLADSEFEHLNFYGEVAQDSMLECVRRGKADVCSATSITASPEGLEAFYRDIDKFVGKMVLRPQEIANSPEVARRLGVISMNTALEADIYGNVNSTHTTGTRMMNGIGGSGDFTRNASISIFVTPSTAKGGKISSIVPMCSHVDHTEHDVMILVTEHGYADLRGKTPKERAQLIIDNCVDPSFRPQMQDYFDRACAQGPAQTPHILSEALSWHTRFLETGSMKKED